MSGWDCVWIGSNIPGWGEVYYTAPRVLKNAIKGKLFVDVWRHKCDFLTMYEVAPGAKIEQITYDRALPVGASHVHRRPRFLCQLKYVFINFSSKSFIP